MFSAPDASRSGRRSSASKRPSRRRSARRTRLRCRAAPQACICSASRPESVPGDEVVTSPYSFVASANCAIYEGATAGLCRHRLAHAEPLARSGRSRDHRAHAGSRRGRHLRLPVRAGASCGRFATPTALRSSRMRARRSERATRAHRSDRRARRQCSRSTRTSRSRPARGEWSRRTRRMSGVC